MESKRQLVCIVCPRGCKIDVTMDGTEIKSIKGFTCKRGEEYAKTECIAPVRTLTTTMRISGANLPLLPVKSQSPVPKGMLFDFMKAINGTQVTAPVAVGDIVLANACGTGINIVASRNMPCKGNNPQ
jgi:CxxC motif-containing protein